MMRNPARTFQTLTVAAYAEMLEYRAELYLWALSGVMPFLLMGLWSKVSAENRLGMPPTEFVRYFLGVFIVRQMTMVWVIWDFDYDVNSGTLSSRLLQPIDPLWRYLAYHVGERFARVPFLALLVAVFFLLYPAAVWVPRPAALALAAVTMALAFAMRFVMQYAFAMLAFWTERANAIEDLWFSLYLFLSGYLAPLDVFPPAARALAEITPFPYMIYLPARVLTGQPVPHLGRGLAIMGAWALGFMVLQRLLWRRGLRRYSAMGA
ncbi:MAG: ABC-2 family transporter protein [Lentisphaeria bacterium]|nr:ABC-2 family transporter protein [Lentisphaeria bacterium]